MKVIIVGDAVVSTGFSRCTHAAADALHFAAHEVHILGINYQGDPHDYPYPVYPCFNSHEGGRDQYGVTRLPRLIASIKPDVVIILQDPWNIPAYTNELRRQFGSDPVPPIIAWLAVDAANHPAKDQLKGVSHVAVWTDFGWQEMWNGGYEGPMSVIPLGVDTNIFYPRNRQESRDYLNTYLPDPLSPSSFLVGVFGRNQLRKRLDLSIAYFADFVNGNNLTNAYLYLHVAPTGERGYDVASLSRYYNVVGKVIHASPHIGKGLPTEHLPLLYSACDVYMTTSQGEGWGLPALEAMACGVPCIVPDWSGLGSWVGNAALKVPCSSTAINAPLNALAYTIGGIPDRRLTVNALNLIYADSGMASKIATNGLALSSTLTWERTGRDMLLLVESFMSTPWAPLQDDTRPVTLSPSVEKSA